MLRAAMLSLLLLGQHVWLAALCAGCTSASTQGCCALPVEDDQACCCCAPPSPADPAPSEHSLLYAPLCPLMPAGSTCAPVCCVIPPQSPASLAEPATSASDRITDQSGVLPTRHDPLIALRATTASHPRGASLDLPSRIRRAMLCVRTI